MLLKLTRSQRDGGIVTKTVVFCLDARAELTAEERANVSRYKLGSQTIYNSEASKRHIEAATAAGISGNAAGLAKAAFRLAMAHLNLNISIDGLCRGQHIECKTLDELMGAEEAIMTACQSLKNYLDTAATFDGRQTLFDFSTGTPVVVAPSAPSSLMAAPALQAATVAPVARLLPLQPSDDPAFASGDAASDSGSAALRTKAAADVCDEHPAQGFDFDSLRERVATWWTHATAGQRVIVSAGGIFGLYLLYHIL